MELFIVYKIVQFEYISINVDLACRAAAYLHVQSRISYCPVLFKFTEIRQRCSTECWLHAQTQKLLVMKPQKPAASTTMSPLHYACLCIIFEWNVYRLPNLNSQLSRDCVKLVFAETIPKDCSITLRVFTDCRRTTWKHRFDSIKVCVAIISITFIFI